MGPYHSDVLTGQTAAPEEKVFEPTSANHDVHMVQTQEVVDHVPSLRQLHRTHQPPAEPVTQEARVNRIRRRIPGDPRITGEGFEQLVDQTDPAPSDITQRTSPHPFVPGVEVPIPLAQEESVFEPTSVRQDVYMAHVQELVGHVSNLHQPARTRQREAEAEQVFQEVPENHIRRRIPASPPITLEGREQLEGQIAPSAACHHTVHLAPTFCVGRADAHPYEA